MAEKPTWKRCARKAVENVNTTIANELLGTGFEQNHIDQG
jgi:enolase